MKKSVLDATVCFLIVFFFFPYPVLAGTKVKAKGMSFFEQGREMIAREKALDEAKRAAIEKAVGTTVESRISMENAEIVKDQIFSHSSGYLKNIEIVEERKTKFGTYEVTIEADVEVSDMVDDLDRFREMLGWQKNPRTAVVIEPELENDYLPAARKAANFLSDKLKRNGFNVFKYSPDEEIKMGLIVEIGIEHATKESNFQNLELTLNEVSLYSRIYRPGDNEILATSNAVKSLPGENRLNVLDKAVKQCVYEIWRELSDKLTRIWEKEIYGERDMLLVARDVPSHEKALEIAEILKTDVSGMADAGLIRFENNEAEIGLKYKGRPEQFVNEIGMSYFRNKHFESNIEEIRGNTVAIRIYQGSTEPGTPISE